MLRNKWSCTKFIAGGGFKNRSLGRTPKLIKRGGEGSKKRILWLGRTRNIGCAYFVCIMSWRYIFIILGFTKSLTKDCNAIILIKDHLTWREEDTEIWIFSNMEFLNGPALGAEKYYRRPFYSFIIPILLPTISVAKF